MITGLVSTLLYNCYIISENNICKEKSTKTEMIRIEAILGKNDVMPISEALKKLNVGGMTVTKMRGRGKNPPPEIHASKGTEIFVPQFADKYVVQVIVPETKEEDVIKVIKENSTVGKIFVSPILRAIDIGTGDEGESVI